MVVMAGVDCAPRSETINLRFSARRAQDPWLGSARIGCTPHMSRWSLIYQGLYKLVGVRQRRWDLCRGETVYEWLLWPTSCQARCLRISAAQETMSRRSSAAPCYTVPVLKAMLYCDLGSPSGCE